MIQNILDDIHHTYQQRGIHNAAIVIAHKETGEIRGLIGNFDYWSGEHGSTIASYSTVRSAGSTSSLFSMHLRLIWGWQPLPALWKIYHTTFEAINPETMVPVTMVW